MNSLGNIKCREYYCSVDGNTPQKMNDKEISLYIVTTRNCTAHCEFCEYNKGKVKLNIESVKRAIDEIVKYFYLKEIHFTGGEPSLESDAINKICKYAKTRNPLVQTSVNTNGFNLNRLESIKDLDNVAISRHAIADSANCEVFGTNCVAYASDILAFKDKSKLHLSCNLIKGYVDSFDKILDYLEFAATLGINDVGLVSLMNINDYCKQHFVDFNKLDIKLTDRFTKTKCCRDIGDGTSPVCCICENYLYQASSMKLVSMYHRYAIQSNKVCSYLVFENGKLKLGFSGKTIWEDKT